MENCKDYPDQSFGTILFMTLFLICALAFSNKSSCQDKDSLPYSSQYELVFSNNSFNENAIIFDAVPVTIFTRTLVCVLHNTSLNLFDLQYQISGYNRRIAQNIISLQEARLSIEPVPLLRFCFHLPLSENKDLPVLS